MKLLGIAGTNGAGKDTIGEILANKHGWLFVSVADILRQQALNLGLTTERHHARQISTAMREKHGPGILVRVAYERFQDLDPPATGLAIASLRNPGEADEVHNLGGQVIWVDADPKIRFNRVNVRARGVEDKRTFDQFFKEEEEEMHHSGDEHTLSLAGVKAKADIFIKNNKSLKDLAADLEKALDL